MTLSGNTYERSTLLRILADNGSRATSPLTRTSLRAADLRPNRQLKDAIDEWRARTATATAAAAAAPHEILASAAPPVVVHKALLVTASATSFPMDVDPRKLLLQINVCSSHPVVDAVKDPCVLAIVIDTSGSMNGLAKESGASDEQDGLTRLDLAKHSARTIVEAMDCNDRLVLVSFENTAKAHVNMELMTVANKARVNAILNRLEAGGGTNMWAGLSMAVQLLSEHPATAASNSAVMFLTDGEPTGMTADDIYMLFSNVARAIPFTLHTIGYGYALDSNLLHRLAVLGRGTFSFVPDSSMVVTVFVNLMAYLVSSYVHAATVMLEVPASLGDTRVRILGTSVRVALERTVDASSGAMQFKAQMGRVSTDTPRTLLLEVAVGVESVESETDLHMRVCVAPRGGDLVITNVLFGADALPVDLFRLACCEVATVAVVAANSFNVDTARARLGDVVAYVQHLHALATSSSSTATAAIERLDDLLMDLNNPDGDKGQIGKAVNSCAWFVKWGKHYLRAEALALEQQFTMNYKDLALQRFLGAHARRVTELLRLVFLSLPPPTPSAVAVVARGSGGSFSARGSSSVPYALAFFPEPALARTPAPAPNMSSYVDNRGGCFDGDGLVKMADGTEKRVRDLVRGDAVFSQAQHSQGQTWRVRALIKQRVPSGHASMVQFAAGNCLTPYHPILIPTVVTPESQLTWSWAFAANASKHAVKKVSIDAFFNVVLHVDEDSSKRGLYIVIDGICVAALGHGLDESTVIAHPYFGTNAVIEDLVRIDPDGWNSMSGHVNVPTTTIIGRDFATGIVSSMT